MAEIVAIFGMTHHPFYFRLTGLPPEQQPAVRARMAGDGWRLATALAAQLLDGFLDRHKIADLGRPPFRTW